MVFTSMSLVPSLVVTPSRLLAMAKKMEPTIGSVPTHGLRIGENKVSSESKKVIVTLIPTSGSVPMLEIQSSFNEEFIFNRVDLT